MQVDFASEQEMAASNRASAPIFVVGSGRSGSTVFFEILSAHPNVAWLSKFARDFPDRPLLNRLLLSGRGVPVLGRALRGRWFSPSEAYPFWELHCPGFSDCCRDLDDADVTPAAAQRIRAAFDGMLTRTRRRVTAKITGWPRILYLTEIFPSALFVHIMRDPCAVASSLLEVNFWDGWRGPPNWRRGPLPPDLDALWHEERRSFVALAGIETVILHRAMRRCIERVPASQLCTIDYARLCASPVDAFKEVTEFCGLAWSAQFERAVRGVALVNRDDKWRTGLTIEQQATLLRVLDRSRET
jgi:hypothetical protein